MANLRLILIALHVLITILLIYNLHPHPSSVPKTCKVEEHHSSIVAYVSHSFSIGLYHSSCIFAIWYSRRYGARLIRASGILLISELLQMLAVTVQHGLQTHSVAKEEFILDFVHVWVCLAAIIVTLRLAKEVFKQEKDLMHLELLSTAMSDEWEGGRGELALV